VTTYVVVATLDETVLHVAPPSALLSTTYAEIDEPPVDVGAVHDSETWVLPAVAVRPLGAIARPAAVALTFALYAP
jgi:hypothetical protein